VSVVGVKAAERSVEGRVVVVGRCLAKTGEAYTVLDGFIASRGREVLRHDVGRDKERRVVSAASCVL
jgi:hypothetical protein